jgi:hypothetical protein
LNFGRVIEIDIESARDKLEIRNLKMSFDVQDQVGDEPAAGRFTIWNMNPDKRVAIRFEKLKKLDRYGNVLTLKAGYGENIKQIYKGNVISAINIKDGPDWRTEIQTVSEVTRLLTAKIKRDQPYPAGIRKSAIFFDIMEDLNIPINQQERSKVQEILGDAKLQKPLTVFGSATDALSQLSKQWKKMINVRYYGDIAHSLVQGDTVNSVPIKINSGNLVGPVEPTSDGINFKTQLDGDLNLYKLVYVESATAQDRTTSGNYATVNVNHRGNNREGDFITSCNCRFPLGERLSRIK